MSEYTIVVECELSVPTVVLYKGSEIVGAWSNHECQDRKMGAGEVAAEVLKVALPDAKVIPYPPHEKSAISFWGSVKTARDVIQKIVERL